LALPVTRSPIDSHTLFCSSIPFPLFLWKLFLSFSFDADARCVGLGSFDTITISTGFLRPVNALVPPLLVFLPTASVIITGVFPLNAPFPLRGMTRTLPFFVWLQVVTIFGTARRFTSFLHRKDGGLSLSLPPTRWATLFLFPFPVLLRWFCCLCPHFFLQIFLLFSDHIDWFFFFLFYAGGSVSLFWGRDIPFRISEWLTPPLA